MSSPLFHRHQSNSVGPLIAGAVVDVLLLEDNLPDAEIVMDMLSDEAGPTAVRFTHVERFGDALQVLSERTFSIALADLSLPDTFGLEVVTRLKVAAPGLPIIVLSGGADIANAVQAVHAGAQDYLVKGRLDGNQLLRAIRYGIERKRIADQLQQALETLEQRVEQRTAQLSEANGQLRLEVAERRRTEEALRIGEAKYRELSELASDAIFITDHSGRFTETNQRASELLGYKREELLQLGMNDVIDPKDLAAMPLYIHARGDGTVLTERLMRRKDGTGVQTESSAKMLPDGRIQAIVRDVTQRVKLEEERQSRMFAERAYEAKSEFLARMSHELRTPLNAILGFGQILEADDLPPDQQKSVAVIMQAGMQLLELVDEVLDITRLDKGTIAMNSEVIPIQEFLLARVTDVARVSAEYGVVIQVEMAGITNEGALADRESLSKVLMTLLTNAIKYNHRGGRVVVSAAETIGDNELCIKVIDNGQGIAADKISRLFMPFERLDGEAGNVKGTGLGLVLAKLLVQAMHGTMGVESELGRGSTFWVRLPFVQSDGVHLP